MAVNDFLQLTEPKQTIEKEVERKPSVEELTTIESPGKPSPASLLENGNQEEKKPKKRKKKPVVEAEIGESKKEYLLIITEKPQAAEKIANAIGKAKKISDSGVSYYQIEEKKILIASAVGHIFNLDYKKGQKGWPIFEIEWKPSFEKDPESFTRKYYFVLKKLSSKAKDFIVATDYDIEGEVIGWNVLRFLCKQKDAKRMKFSTLTSEELKKSFESPEKSMNWGNAYAGEARHIIDWLYGINLSRALMSAIKKTGSFKILSIGRVQGPALKIIVDREREINNFKSKPYWQIFASAKEINFKHPRNVFEKDSLEIFKKIKKAKASTKKTEQKMSPPVPFDLTTLQKEAYRMYKMNPSQTLSTAQKLYLEGLISYPRTSSQKIPEAIEPKKILKKLAKYFPEASKVSRANPVEGKKSDPAHPSIYPTGEYESLDGQEEKLYNLIVKRFISCFYSDLITANKRITLLAINEKGSTIKYLSSDYLEEVNEEDEIEKKEREEIDITFTASAQTILEKGWSAVYPYFIEESTLPDIEGEVNIENINIEEKKTLPPSRFSPTSLVSLLEKKNLGTKATRSMIVDTLFSRGYLDGKSIEATPLGVKLIESLEKYSSIIIDENLTQELEKEMEKIQESKENFEFLEKEVIEKSKKIIQDISKEFKAKEMEIGQELSLALQDLRKEQQEANELMPCPTCKLGNLRILYSKKTRRFFIACSKYPDCKQTYSVPPNSLIKKSDKICPADNFPKLLAIRKARRPWEFCFNPQCPIEIEKKKVWQAKKQAKE